MVSCILLVGGGCFDVYGEWGYTVIKKEKEQIPDESKNQEKEI